MDVKIKLDDEKYTWTSAAQSIYAMLQYTNQKNLSLAEVMGYSTHAFRLNIHPVSVSPAGPTMFDPYDLISNSLETLGIATITYSHPAPIPDEKLANVIRFAQSRIDTGVPAITWDIFAPEFGLLYGYDNDKQILYAKDIEKDGTIKYSELNERRFNHIFICGYREHLPTNQKVMLKNALKRILEHADGKSVYASSHEYKYGLAGYEAWMNAFKGDKINPFGNAYNSAVVADARHYAHRFFTDILSKWNETSDLDQQVMVLLKDCEEIYNKIAETLSELPILFPFPQGGNPKDPIIRQRAIEILREAYEWEQKGVELLRKLSKLMDKFKDDTFMTPRLWEKTLEFVGEKHEGKIDNISEDIPMKMKKFLKREDEIPTRLLSEEIYAFERRKNQNQEMHSYVVARPVSMKPDQIPTSMHYYKESGRYAFIRANKRDREKAYQLIERWIKENGYDRDLESLLIEYIRYAQEPGKKDEIEIYIPLK